MCSSDLKCILSESTSPKSASVPIMYRHYVRTILYYGIFALSISAVMGIFRNGAILHVACTIGLGSSEERLVATTGGQPRAADILLESREGRGEVGIEVR